MYVRRMTQICDYGRRFRWPKDKKPIGILVIRVFGTNTVDRRFELCQTKGQIVICRFLVKHTTLNNKINDCLAWNRKTVS